MTKKLKLSMTITALLGVMLSAHTAKAALPIYWDYTLQSAAAVFEVDGGLYHQTFTGYDVTSCTLHRTGNMDCTQLHFYVAPNAEDTHRMYCSDVTVTLGTTAGSTSPSALEYSGSNLVYDTPSYSDEIRLSNNRLKVPIFHFHNRNGGNIPIANANNLPEYIVGFSYRKNGQWRGASLEYDFDDEWYLE